jgi:hypothetical protein
MAVVFLCAPAAILTIAISRHNRIFQTARAEALFAEDIRGFSWLTQTKRGEEFGEENRAFRMETVGGPLVFMG